MQANYERLNIFRHADVGFLLQEVLFFQFHFLFRESSLDAYNHELLFGFSKSDHVDWSVFVVVRCLVGIYCNCPTHRRVAAVEKRNTNRIGRDFVFERREGYWLELPWTKLGWHTLGWVESESFTTSRPLWDQVCGYLEQDICSQCIQTITLVLALCARRRSAYCPESFLGIQSPCFI